MASGPPPGSHGTTEHDFRGRALISSGATSVETFPSPELLTEQPARVAGCDEALRLRNGGLRFWKSDLLLEQRLRELAIVLSATRRSVCVDLARFPLQRAAALPQHLGATAERLRRNPELM